MSAADRSPAPRPRSSQAEGGPAGRLPRGAGPPAPRWRRTGVPILVALWLLPSAWAWAGSGGQPPSASGEPHRAGPAGPVQPGGQPPAVRAGAALAADARRSGWHDLSAPLQAMQADDSLHPGALWWEDGERRWAQPAGAARRSCASCHGPAQQSMRGVAARYPQAAGAASADGSADATLVWDLADRIRHCQRHHQGAEPSPRESDALLGLQAWVARASRGWPIEPAADRATQAAADRGQALWHRRLGQLDLACVHCHDQRAGQRLGGSRIPQGHPTGYPLYRLEWQGMGSLQRRLRGCLVGVRAQTFDPDAPQWRELEAYLMRRAAGMAMDAPAVRP